ncbi:hypothetical protein MJO29_014532 [Puccinia striiformis f. sp. tritici]|uniref:hypothetical protein n=1 Tax=Puccinia striiformis f. sp. tritici TaxID=168172 RepID=UPI002007675F|nr:hypothetical protein Pst134EA_027105 [Puccinia striiformis f. sp. tritici]KAH9450402.1 hypothetical protein Pst134EA_027105 [Puccinia striiformis f. sp. tritici]KAI7939796.1 hypothetical protein MJO29_014532 [Puccinia striiformis f. sp. tritici]KAI9624011.1 hypothetical protein H4Q26_017022 [Puccinia striiformis f. sp. tritici PST-130]
MEFSVEQITRLQPNLISKTRADGRAALQARTSQSHSAGITSAHGSTIYSTGNTSVVCALKLEIATPESSKPNQGFIVPNIDLGPMCSPKYRSGPPNDESQILSSRLKDILTSSGFLSLDSLVIHPNKFVWVIYVDIVCLSNDGNLFDAIFNSTFNTLKTVKIPRVKFDQDRNQVILSDPSKPDLIPLEIKDVLKAYSFAIFNQEKIWIDPTGFEEDTLCPGILHLIIDQDYQFRYVNYLAPSSSINHEDSPIIFSDMLRKCLDLVKGSL